MLYGRGNRRMYRCFLILFLTPSIFAYLVPRGYTYDFFRPPYTVHIYIVLTLLARLRVCLNAYTAAGTVICIYTHPTYISHYPTDSIYRLLLTQRAQTTARSAIRRCSLKEHPFFHRCYNITIIIILYVPRAYIICVRAGCIYIYIYIYLHGTYTHSMYIYVYIVIMV